MEPDWKKEVLEAIALARLRLAEQGQFKDQDVAAEVIATSPDIWKKSRDKAAVAFLAEMVHDSTKKATSDDPRQMDLFGLEGYELISPLVNVAGQWWTARALKEQEVEYQVKWGELKPTEDIELMEYRLVMERLGLRLKSYNYARRSEAARARDEKQYAQMRKFEPTFARLSAGNEHLGLRGAAELHAAEQQSPRIQARRKGGYAKSARTKNQRLKHTRK